MRADTSACTGADHADGDDLVERGARYLGDTPRQVRGPAIPALKAMGLTTRQAVEAVRVHALRMARAA